MKKRIISFLLALVMLFSVMSLSIFAAGTAVPAGEECVHEWVESHHHNAANGCITNIKTCKLCGEVEEDAVYMGSDNYNLSAAEIAERVAAGDIIINSEFAKDTTTRPTPSNISNYAGTRAKKGQFLLTVGGDSYPYIMIDTMNCGTVENPDYYIGAQEPVDYNGDAWTGIRGREYIRWYSSGNQKNELKNDSTLLGRAYSVTFDFKWDGADSVGAPQNIFQNVTSYTKADYSKLSGAWSFRVGNDGYLKFIDNGTSNQTNVQLTPGEWVQITVYHTPVGLDGVRNVDETNGKIIAGSDDNTYHAFVNGVHVGTYQAVPNSDVVAWKDSTTGKWMNSAADFAIQEWRYGLYHSTIAMDDLRFYYGAPAECVHSNIVDNTCVWCGETDLYPYCEECDIDLEYDGYVLGNGATVTGRDVTLGENIDLGLYLELSEDLLADANAKVVVSVDDGYGTKVVKAVSELEEAPEANGGNGGYVVSIPLRSIDMNKKVTFAVMSGEEQVGATYTTTVADYLKDLYEASEDDAEKELIVAALNYGAYAQKYFAVKNNNAALAEALPNAGYEVDVTTKEDPNLADYNITVNGDASALTGISLVLTSQAQMKIYFTEAITAVKVVGADAEIVAAGGKYYVTVDGASPAELGAAKEIVFTYANASTVTVTASVYAVLADVLEDANAGADYKNLAEAMYIYGEAAKAYVGN